MNMLRDDEYDDEEDNNIIPMIIKATLHIFHYLQYFIDDYGFLANIQITMMTITKDR